MPVRRRLTLHRIQHVPPSSTTAQDIHTLHALTFNKIHTLFSVNTAQLLSNHDLCPLITLGLRVEAPNGPTETFVGIRSQVELP